MANNNKPTQQQDDAGCKTFSVKVPAWVHETIEAIADSLQPGTNGNDLVKKCLMFLIETAKIDGPVPPEFRTLLNMLKLDPSWHKAFNFADSAACMDIAQVVLVLQQSNPDGTPRNGFGLVKIDKPFFGRDAHMTLCVDDILERVCEVSMPGLYKQVRQIGTDFDSQSLRETLTLLCDNQTIANLDEMDRMELPGMGDSEYGRPYIYGRKTKTRQHRTPDGEANRQMRLLFDDFDRSTGDGEAYGTSTNKED